MYPPDVRLDCLELLAHGCTVSEASRRSGLSRSPIRGWRDAPDRAARAGHGCPVCDADPLDGSAYAALLGYYLGDGCLSRAPRYFAFRVSCDAGWPGIIEDVDGLMRKVRPGVKVFRVAAAGVVVVQSHWQHWPCLFPQHGPGRKHERPIVLEKWQRQIVETHPGAFLRGLFHSDGCRAKNWTRKLIRGEMKRYDYPRWQFTNNSADIRELCCWALNLVDVAWRQSNWKTISVSRRAAVARLDELIGPKS